MEISSNRKLYFKVKYGSAKAAKLIILARRKKHHTILYRSYTDWLYDERNYFGQHLESHYHKKASRSWHALRLISRLAMSK